MRLHVTCHGKQTTVSIDDQLIDYLGAWIVEDHPQYHTRAKKQQDEAKAYIKRYVATIGDDLPTKNLSQHIQAFIIQVIAAPGLEAIIKARGPRYQKSKPDLRAMFPDYDKILAEMTAKTNTAQR